MEGKNIKVYGTLISLTLNSEESMRDSQHDDLIAVAYQLYDERFAPKKGSGRNGAVVATDKYQDIINKRLTAIYYDSNANKTTIDGDVDINGSLTAVDVAFTQDVTFNDNTTFNENVSFNDEVIFNENVDFKDDITIEGDVYVEDNHEINTYNIKVRNHADIEDLTIDSGTPGHIHGVFLNDLEDVNIRNLQDGQVLTYDASLRKWVAKDVESGGGSGGGISYKVVKRTGEWVSVTSSGNKQWFLPYYSMSISDAEHVASAFCDSYTNGLSGILRTILACDYISEAYASRPAIGWFSNLSVSEDYSRPTNPIFTFIMSNAVVDGNTTTEGDLDVNGDLTVTGDTTLNNLTINGDISGISLNDLDDVNASSPQTGQVLKWNGSKWAPATHNTGGSGGGVDLSSATGSLPIDKLDTTGATEGSIIKFDGTKWAIGVDETGSGSSDITDPDEYVDPDTNISEWENVKISSNGFYGIWRPVKAYKSLANWRTALDNLGGYVTTQDIYGTISVPMSAELYDRIVAISITKVYTNRIDESDVTYATSNHNHIYWNPIQGNENGGSTQYNTSDINREGYHRTVTTDVLLVAFFGNSLSTAFGSFTMGQTGGTQGDSHYMEVNGSYANWNEVLGLLIPLRVDDSSNARYYDAPINENMPYFVVRVSFV